MKRFVASIYVCTASNIRSLCWLVRYYVDLSDNFVVICMTLLGEEHIFKIHFLTNE